MSNKAAVALGKLRWKGQTEEERKEAMKPANSGSKRWWANLSEAERQARLKKLWEGRDRQRVATVGSKPEGRS